MSWHTMAASVVLSVTLAGDLWAADATRFAQTHSRSNYVHWIDLYDANNRKIVLSDENPPPYSPKRTCGRCHDYDAMSHGHHFNANRNIAEPGRPGEPWIWIDPRTGTQLPLSYRGWEGTHHPDNLGISPRQFVLQFGRQLPGGGPGEPDLEPADDAKPETPTAEADTGGDESEAAASEATEPEEPAADEPAGDTARWKLSGPLNIDCMFCHHNDGAYSPEAWWEQIRFENFAWAPTAALGIGTIKDQVKSLPDDFDPETADETSRYKLPQTTYANLRINAENKVFFDVVRQPHNSTCYYCHTTRPVGETAPPEWTHDEDVHIRAGMSCADCHRNDLEHHTVRGYEGEVHPSGLSVASLSCRGCHMGDDEESGRLGAPKPLHKGLPPLHLEKMSCTSCHSGPRPSDEALQIQTAMAHGLGLQFHGDISDLAPGLVAPVMKRDGDTLYPHKMMWPAFWGAKKDDKITPLNPEEVYDAVKRALRVRSSSTLIETFMEAKISSSDKKELLGEERAKASEEELTDEEQAKLAEFAKTKGLETWQEKMAEALTALKAIVAKEGAEPVYISGGKAYRLDKDGKVQEFEHEATNPYAWKLAHDVRSARQSSGVKGCYECHSAGSPILEGQVTAIGPAPDDSPPTKDMYAYTGYDKTKMDAWNSSFQGRTAFKYFGFAAMGVLGLVLLSSLVAGINGLYGKLRRKND
jgi:hypothetical protein